MLSRFIPLILCLVTMYGGCQMFKINDGKTNENTKITAKDLCEKGVKVMAVIQNEYTEMEVGSSVSYQYKYDYDVNGKKYTGNISKKEELEIPVIEITYNPDHPESSTTVDPCKTYAAIKDNPGRWPQWMEMVGAGIFILGLGFVQSSAVRAIKG